MAKRSIWTRNISTGWILLPVAAGLIGMLFATSLPKTNDITFPEQRPVAKRAVQEEKQDKTHTVQSGEWLSKIALKYYGSVDLFDELASYNGIADPNSLKVGQELKIPYNLGGNPRIDEITIYPKQEPSSDDTKMEKLRDRLLAGTSRTGVEYSTAYIDKENKRIIIINRAISSLDFEIYDAYTSGGGYTIKTSSNEYDRLFGDIQGILGSSQPDSAKIAALREKQRNIGDRLMLALVRVFPVPDGNGGYTSLHETLIQAIGSEPVLEGTSFATDPVGYAFDFITGNMYVDDFLRTNYSLVGISQEQSRRLLEIPTQGNGRRIISGNHGSGYIRSNGSYDPKSSRNYEATFEHNGGSQTRNFNSAKEAEQWLREQREWSDRMKKSPYSSERYETNPDGSVTTSKKVIIGPSDNYNRNSDRSGEYSLPRSQDPTSPHYEEPGERAREDFIRDVNKILGR